MVMTRAQEPAYMIRVEDPGGPCGRALSTGEACPTHPLRGPLLYVPLSSLPALSAMTGGEVLPGMLYLDKVENLDDERPQFICGAGEIGGTL
jgi:hypothetical protein